MWDHVLATTADAGWVSAVAAAVATLVAVAVAWPQLQGRRAAKRQEEDEARDRAREEHRILFHPSFGTVVRTDRLWRAHPELSRGARKESHHE